MTNTIYCIPMLAETQKEPLDKHCFGDCGKISMSGAVDTGRDVVGPCWVCTQAQCPYSVDDVGPIGESSLTGDTIYIRVIQMDPILRVCSTLDAAEKQA